VGGCPAGSGLNQFVGEGKEKEPLRRFTGDKINRHRPSDFNAVVDVNAKAGFVCVGIA